MNCLGLAGMQASGLMQAHDDASMARRLTAGVAAEAGARSALLAQLGFTGPHRILEGDHGYYKAIGVSAEIDVSRLFGSLGQEWMTRDLIYKARPIAGWNNAPLEALERLHREHAFTIDDIEAIDAWQEPAGLHGGAPAREFRTRPHIDTETFSAVAAQQSLRFTLATYLVHGRVTVDEYTNDKLDDPQTHAMLNRIRTHYDPDLVRRTPPDALAGRVVITLRNGIELAAEVDYPKGSSGNPLSEGEFREKFMALSTQTIHNRTAQELYERILGLESETDMVTILDLLLK